MTKFRAYSLIWTARWRTRWRNLANATNHALAALGCPTHPVAAYRYFIGDGSRNLCCRALPADRQHLADKLLQLKQTHYEADRFDETSLIGLHGWRVVCSHWNPNLQWYQDTFCIGDCERPGLYEYPFGDWWHKCWLIAVPDIQLAAADKRPFRYLHCST